MFQAVFKKVILKDFFAIELSGNEKNIAKESIKHKYSQALLKTIIYSLLAVFPILFLETNVLISVLIPITMVAGTAWFSISLANMKQKFDKFGLELTTNLFEAFSISLGLLFMLSVFSLGDFAIDGLVEGIENQYVFQTISLVLGVLIIGNIIYKIFIGSIKYDINDAMLTGQNEAAEKFFRKALSLLHTVSHSLRDGKSLQLANYYIGVAFFEIFTYMQNLGIKKIDFNKFIDKSNELVKHPSMDQKHADKIAYELINKFLKLIKNPQGNDSLNSIQAINDEMECIKKNKDENQEMKDTRFAIIFEEIAGLLDGQGESLFIKQ